MCEAYLFDSGACQAPAPGWACNPAYYHGGAADGCDCECGVWDPDCNDPAVDSTGRFVFGCGTGQVCVNQQTSLGVFAPTCVTPVVPH
jgi:hypothetical protein